MYLVPFLLVRRSDEEENTALPLMGKKLKAVRKAVYASAAAAVTWVGIHNTVYANGFHT